MFEREVQLDSVMPMIKQSLAEGKTVRFTPKGTSMRPTIRGGEDSVELAPVPSGSLVGKVALYRRKNGEYVLHRIVADDGKAYTCRGDNQSMNEYPIYTEQVIAIMCALHRNGKTYKTDDRRYALFCALQRRIRYARRKLENWIRRLFG